MFLQIKSVMFKLSRRELHNWPAQRCCKANVLDRTHSIAVGYTLELSQLNVAVDGHFIREKD